MASPLHSAVCLNFGLRWAVPHSDITATSSSRFASHPLRILAERSKFGYYPSSTGHYGQDVLHPAWLSMSSILICVLRGWGLCIRKGHSSKKLRVCPQRKCAQQVAGYARTFLVTTYHLLKKPVLSQMTSWPAEPQATAIW